MKKNLLSSIIGIFTLFLLFGCPTPNDPISIIKSNNEITAFSFTAEENIALSSDCIGIINGINISITVPHGTDVTALVSSFTTTGESVTVSNTTQTSGTTANNFTNPLLYTVAGSDRNAQDYTVTVAFEAATEGSGFNNVSIPGDSGVLTLSESAETLTMIYTNDSTSITFPTGTDDSGNATLTTKFWMGETEVTNTILAEVFQWAYNNGRFSSTVSDHNGLDTATAKHGDQQLLDLDSANCRVDYNGSGVFTVESGYEDHPVTNVTWYGSVMFCNWLTEMRDGNTSNLVYANIDTSWTGDETTEIVSNTGYRLPSADEWEFTARYRDDNTNTYDEATYSNPWFTKGNSASGASADYNDLAACQQVAVYYKSSPVPHDEAVVKSLGVGSTNALGLYDMSGNVWEWTTSGSSFITQGGGWNYIDESYLQVGFRQTLSPDHVYYALGFRLCRTAD